MLLLTHIKGAGIIFGIFLELCSLELLEYIPGPT